MHMKVTLLFCQIFVCLYQICLAVEFQEKLKEIIAATDASILSLRKRWDIDHFPNFLKSVAMSPSAWEVLKVKFEHKILSAFQSPGSAQFVMSFMGSSVAAGHDSPFNKSFPIVTGDLMESALSSAGIKVVARNSAMGNNPCVPYDICPRAFAGPDADIVHWEQTYNCDGGDSSRSGVYEQFVRQSLSFPSHPIVVFTASDTPNWNKNDCNGVDRNPLEINAEEKQLLTMLDSNPMKIPTDLNRNELSGWSALTKILQTYKTAGIQVWKHGHYSSYKCRGPYVSNWGCCSASWHPSLLGHELRASHHAFFWLLIFKEAALNLQKKNANVNVLLPEITKHIDAQHNHIPITPVHDSPYTDGLQCYVTFEPRYDPQSSLYDIILPGPSGPTKQFQLGLFESFVDRTQGYKDFKFMLYGNKTSDPLSLKAHVSKEGPGFLCTPPAIWGAYSSEVNKFWTTGTKVYLTKNVGKDIKTFTFNKDNAEEIPYLHQKPQDTQFICVDFTKKLPPGDHVLTIVPFSTNYIMISVLILP